MPCQGKQSGWRVENLWEMAKHSTPRLIPSPWKSLIGVFFHPHILTQNMQCTRSNLESDHWSAQYLILWVFVVKTTD